MSGKLLRRPLSEWRVGDRVMLHPSAGGTGIVDEIAELAPGDPSIGVHDGVYLQDSGWTNSDSIVPAPPMPPRSAPRAPWVQRMDLAMPLPAQFRWCGECAAAVDTCKHAGWSDSCGPQGTP